MTPQERERWEAFELRIRRSGFSSLRVTERAEYAKLKDIHGAIGSNIDAGKATEPPSEERGAPSGERHSEIHAPIHDDTGRSELPATNPGLQESKN